MAEKSETLRLAHWLERDGANCQAHMTKQQADPPQITHAENCWSWGPSHYECACEEIAKMKGWKK